MKKLSYILISFLALAACAGDDEPTTTEPKQDYTSVVIKSNQEDFSFSYISIFRDSIRDPYGKMKYYYTPVSNGFYLDKKTPSPELIISDTIRSIFLMYSDNGVYDTCFFVEKGEKNILTLENYTKIKRLF